jgi:hypothetical protein
VPPIDFGDALLYGLAKMGVVGFMKHLSLRIFMAETQGYTNPSLGLEDVRDHVSEILDETGYTVPVKSGTG